MARTGGGPRSGDGTLEIYLKHTVSKVPPVSVTNVKGVRPGQAVADDANFGADADLRIHGELRQAALTDPTVEIHFPNLGIAPRSSFGVAEIIRATDLTRAGSSSVNVSTLLRIQNAALGGSPQRAQVELGAPVPRFGVIRTNYTEAVDGASPVGATENFHQTASTWDITYNSLGDAVTLVVDERRNRLLMAFLDASAGVWSLKVYRYDPAIDTVWTHLVTDSGIDTDVGLASQNALTISGTARGDVVYFSVTFSDGTDGSLFIYQLVGDTLSLHSEDAVSLPTWGTPSAGADFLATDAGFVFAGAFVDNLGDPIRRTLNVAHSPDGQIWSTDPSALRTPDFTSVGDLYQVLALSEAITSIHFADSDYGWAVTDQGRIYASSDGGRSWARQASPTSPEFTTDATSIPLRRVRARSTNLETDLNLPPKYAVYVVGDSSTILKTVDSGANWNVRRHSKTFEASIAHEYKQGANPTQSVNEDIPYNGLDFQDDDVAVLVGGGGLVLVTDDGWELSFSEKRNLKSPGDYTDVRFYDTDKVIAVGTSGVHSVGGLAAGDRTLTIAQGEDIQTGSPTWRQRFATSSRAGVLSISFAEDTVYGITASGFVIKWTSASDAWTRPMNKQLVTSRMAYDSVQAIDADTVLIAGRRLYRSINGGTSFMDIAHPLTSPQVGSYNLATSLYFTDKDTGMLGANGGMAFGENILNNRVFPRLLGLPGGVVLLACLNVTRGRIEVYRSTDFGHTFVLVNDQIESGAGAATGTYYHSSDPRPSLTVDDFGNVLLIAGLGRGTDPANPSPPTAAVGIAGALTGTYKYKITTRVENTLIESLPSTEVSVALTSDRANIGFTAAGSGRETVIYRTEADKETFWRHSVVSGATTNIVDNTLDEDLEFIPTPSEFDGGLVSPNDGLHWLPRNDPSLPFVLGRSALLDGEPDWFDVLNTANATRVAIAFMGRLFSVRQQPSVTKLITDIARDFDSLNTPTHFVPITGRKQWIGVDKVQCQVIGDPAIGDFYTVTPDSDYPATNLTVMSPSCPLKSKGLTGSWVLEWNRRHADTVALFAALTGGSGAGSHFAVSGAGLFKTNFLGCTLRCSKHSYTGGSFPTAPGDYDDYALSALVYTKTASSSGMPGVLAVSGTLQPDELAPGFRQFYLFHATAGTFRILGNGPGTISIDRTSGSDITGTVYIFSDRMFVASAARLSGNLRYAQFVRLIVPEASSTQGIYGTERQIGRPVIGIHIGAIGGVCERFETGYQWQPVANVDQEIGPSGVGSQRNYGSGQVFRLPYHALPWNARDKFLAGISDDIRQDVAACFNGEDSQAVELVQLREGPSYVNDAGDYFSFQPEFVEVL